MKEKRHHIILLVDDDEDDSFMMRQAIKALAPKYEVQQVCNGWEALAKLDKLKTAGNLPCLVVLDINMPKMDGKQTLVALQRDEQLKDISIVILTTSSSSADKIFFKQKQVEMITKPAEVKALYEVAARLLGYCNPELC